MDGRGYGVRYPKNIKAIGEALSAKAHYYISFEYSGIGRINVIHIDDPQ